MYIYISRTASFSSTWRRCPSAPPRRQGRSRRSRSGAAAAVGYPPTTGDAPTATAAPPPCAGARANTPHSRSGQ